MDNENPKVAGHSAEDGSLETVDGVARATHLWVRSLCMNEFQTEEERQAVARGLITGLCRHLKLDTRIKELVMYIYTLFDGEGDRALAVSRLMSDQPVSPSMRHAYYRGETEATGIVEMLDYHGRRERAATQEVSK